MEVRLELSHSVIGYRTLIPICSFILEIFVVFVIIIILEKVFSVV